MKYVVLSIYSYIAESKRDKYIDIKHLFVQDNVAAGIIQIERISTMDTQADIFTKSLDTTQFQILWSMVGVTRN